MYKRKLIVDDSERENAKKLKHRQVERVRHHKLQELINKLALKIPDDNSLQNTQCSILKKTSGYIQFLVNECNRICEIKEVENYSSSQGTVSSSQGPLVIDESCKEEITCHVDVPDSYNSEYEKQFPPLPSSLLSPDQDFYDLTQPLPAPPQSLPDKWIESVNCSSQQWNDYQSPYPSPPPTSPLFQPSSFIHQRISTTNHQPTLNYQYTYFEPLTDHKNSNQQFAHCQSCCCFSGPNFNNNRDFRPNNMKSFAVRDHLLTETIHDQYILEPDLAWI